MGTCLRYYIKFQSTPPPRSLRIIHSADQDNPICQEVTKHLEKKAVEKVPYSATGGYCSTFFLRPKKTGGLRPILNLKPLNKYLVTKSFKIDHIGVIVNSLWKSLYAVSLDLTNTYLHIAIRYSHRKYLRFALSKTERFQFRVLCFGVQTTP